MVKFRGYWLNALSLLFCALMGGLILAGGFVGMEQRSAVAAWALRLFFGLGGAGMLWHFGYGLLECFTVYALDENGITRYAWNGTRALQWSDLARYEASGHVQGTVTLLDHQNRALLIYFSLLSARRNAELRALLAPHLAPLAERQLRDIGSLNTVYRPFRNLRILCGVICIALSGLFVVMPLTDHAAFDPLWLLVPFFVGFLGMLALGVWFLLHGLTYALTITPQGITESNCFRTTRLPFEQVTSLWVSEPTHDSKQGAVTTLEGNGVSIRLSSSMKDYSLLVHYIRARVSAAAIQRGDAIAQASQAKVVRQSRVLLPILLTVVPTVCMGFGLNMVVRSAQSLSRYRLLDTQGITATGQVLESEATGDKNKPYVIRYTFASANGRRMESVDPVFHADYQRLCKGDAVHVRYVPGQPAISAIAQSVGRRYAVGDIFMGSIFVACAAGIPLVVFWEARSKRRAASNTA